MPKGCTHEEALISVLVRLCERLGPLSEDQILQLPYLVDVVAKHVLGRPITEGPYQAQERGVVHREVLRLINKEKPPMGGDSPTDG